KHVLWMIENQPGNAVTGSPEGRLRPEDAGFDQAKRLWMGYLDKPVDDLSVLRAGGNFFTVTDNALAARFFERGESIATTDPYWPYQLGNVYMFSAMAYGVKPSTTVQYASKALSAFERAAALTPENMARNGLGLSDVRFAELAEAAFRAE